MKAEEKEAVMEGFRRGDIRLLVTTTVIEVGVDVPNATVMWVEDADRYGLSQLHQLRGRVGRGGERAYCVLRARPPLTAEAEARLAVMAETADGFQIADRDLEIRGPGEMFGTKQAGAPDLRFTRLLRPHRPADAGEGGRLRPRGSGPEPDRARAPGPAGLGERALG